MEHEYDRIPYLVRRARLLMGMTQEAFAKEFDVDPGTVSRWERGKLQPAPHVWKRIREIALIAGGPLSEEVITASPLMKRVARMEDLKTSQVVSKGLLEEFGILPGDRADATKLGLVPPSHLSYCVSSARLFDIVQQDPQWLKGGIVYAEGHCLAIALKQWVDAMIAPLPDRDAALIECAISRKGEEGGFWVRIAYTDKFFREVADCPAR